MADTWDFKRKVSTIEGARTKDHRDILEKNAVLDCFETCCKLYSIYLG